MSKNFSQGVLSAISRRDLLLLIRRPMALLNPILFSLLIVSLFPLGIGTESHILTQVAPGVILMITLLACVMTTDGMYREDFEDGSLILMLLSPQNQYFLQMIRVWVYWVASGFMISLSAPLMAIMLNLPINSCLDVFLTLMLSSVSLVFLGAIGAALTVSLKNTGILLVLIIMPMYVPVLIVGSAAIQASLQGLDSVNNYLSLLAALACLTLSLSPLAIQGALKINLEAS